MDIEIGYVRITDDMIVVIDSQRSRSWRSETSNIRHRAAIIKNSVRVGIKYVVSDANNVSRSIDIYTVRVREAWIEQFADVSHCSTTVAKGVIRCAGLRVTGDLPGMVDTIGLTVRASSEGSQILHLWIGGNTIAATRRPKKGVTQTIGRD